MAIRLPLTTVLDKTFGPSATPGSASVAGIEVATFNLPQDTDNVLMKIQSASVSGTGSITALFQTSDDGGSTWYDVARSPFFGTSASQTTSVINANAFWVSVPVVSSGVKSTVIGQATVSASVLAQGSILSVTGQAISQTLGPGQMSGLPILGIANRVVLQYGGVVTTNDGIRIKVLANSQSATA